MSEFINNFLNLERCEWLVRALIETIHLDEDIQENEEFLIDYDTIVCADDLPFVSNVVLEPFLISVLHYVLLNSPDAESGRPTFESWYSQSSKNAEWKLHSDIGSNISPLRVYSRLPEVNEDASTDDAPEERMGAAIITRHADTAPDLALYTDGIFYLEEGLIDVSEDSADTDDEDIRLYLEKIGQKYGSVRTLLNPYQQTPVQNIYVCNDIIRNVPIPGRFRNTYTVEYIHNASSQDLAACSNFVIIIGTGGIGKSMMIRNGGKRHRKKTRRTEQSPAPRRSILEMRLQMILERISVEVRHLETRRPPVPVIQHSPLPLRRQIRRRLLRPPQWMISCSVPLRFNIFLERTILLVGLAR